MMAASFARYRLRLLALRDLCARYLDCLRHAWSVRRELDGPSYRHDEAEFLAGALALQRSPPSPAPRVALWLICAFALLALLWAIFGKVDVVATAAGKIVPSGHSKAIQAIETASVKSIRVRDGDSVHAGDLLLELDATVAAADVDRVENERIAARLQALRSQAMLAAMTGGRLPLISAADLPATRIAEATRQAEGMHAEYSARLARLQADIDRRQAELQSTQQLIRKLEQTLPITRGRAQDYQDLQTRGFVSRHAWLEKEQARLDQEGELAMQQSRLSEIRAALRETQGQRSALVAETRRQLLDAAAEGTQKAESLKQELLKAEAREKLTRIVAPIDGTVQQLAINTVGGVVTPAQVLMLLVPDQQPIEIDAVLENKDIGFVKPGQVVEIKVETFPYTRYGTIPGTVLHLSHDAVGDEERGLTYLAKIRMEKSSLQVNGRDVQLHPGMAVVAEIKTGRRRVIDYFLSPLLEHTSESLRER